MVRVAIGSTPTRVDRTVRMTGSLDHVESVTKVPYDLASEWCDQSPTKSSSWNPCTYVTLDQSCFILQAINLVTFSFQPELFSPFFGYCLLSLNFFTPPSYLLLPVITLKLPFDHVLMISWCTDLPSGTSVNRCFSLLEGFLAPEVV